jgi:hypothetical protein
VVLVGLLAKGDKRMPRHPVADVFVYVDNGKNKPKLDEYGVPIRVRGRVIREGACDTWVGNTDRGKAALEEILERIPPLAEWEIEDPISREVRRTEIGQELEELGLRVVRRGL